MSVVDQPVPDPATSGQPALDPSVPTPPNSAYLRAVEQATGERIAAADHLTSAHTGAPGHVRTLVAASVAELSAELVGLSRDLHAHPEPAYAEHRSARVVAELVARAGHQAAVGVGGLDTALLASAGTGHPHVAVLAEYDALPGIGHGCGHNIICAAGVGGFLGAAAAIAHTGGRVSLVGTPAEEGGGGKERLARAGVFDDVDAVVMLHPFPYDVATHPFLGRRQVEMVFTGIAAHASAQPFMGRNALDAAVTAYQGVAALRQHIPGTDRIHGVFTDGGARPNVVPDRAAVLFYFRSPDPDLLRDLSQRVERIAQGAALLHGVGVELRWDPFPPYLPIRHNHTLARRWAVHQRDRGRKALGPGVVPESLTGSTDLGNLSFRMPAIHPMIAVGQASGALHTVEFAEAAGSADGDRAVLDGAHGLAQVAADYLADPVLREAVHEEFAAAGGPVDVPNFFS
ncbi:M20 family metallopeptidase [Goodfellowiella coeruleoviolacea]|uniref:Peptidase M20 domain-containing protein 2 n=1 Tax=Goodfellowiella coeruleoviolacea TaxID=334858 RepID=A0AAE3GDB1_9PSEU|nr:M20 family metallopeptidase [Goodfellowiella coeruleoviolacea]MCP2165147.1 amidohydrolase [Goodfellowiella coeruleoviolacea]